MSYIFKSERLGFRNWIDSNIPKMAKINSDSDVMEFFPAIQDSIQTKEFILRMQKQYLRKGFCYFAVEELKSNLFIGFIGFSEQNFEAPFTPMIDIGWRLSKQHWEKGYATEGAKSCLEYAFNNLKLTTISATCPIVNKNSEHVMHKIGMVKKQNFNHPALENHKHLQKCVLYTIENSKFN